MKRFKKGVVKKLFSDTIPDYITKLSDEDLLDLEKNYHAQRKKLETKNPMEASVQQTATLLDSIQKLIDEEKTKRALTTDEGSNDPV
jgi:cytochrome c553